jgi:arginyl-tRNA synthetase
MDFDADIKKTIIDAYPDLDTSVFDIQPAPQDQQGDIGLACFRLAASLGMKPPQAAQAFAGLTYPPFVSAVTATGPYLNFTLDRNRYASALIEDILTRGASFGSSGSGVGIKAVLEHTSINPNASPHIGRARNGLIGDTLARLLRFEGYDVDVHYYVNDMGKQIGLLALETENMPELEFHQVLEVYVRANERAKTDPSFEARGLELLAGMEAGDPKVTASFKRIVDICLAGQLAIFNRLGLSFDTFDRESSFLRSPRMEEVLATLRERGVLFTDDQGRVVADLAPLGYPREEGRYVVLMRANGSSMYMYRDIAYTLEKLSRGGAVNIIVLGEDHKMYFEQLSVIVRAMGGIPPEPMHYSYILLREGKMSTRQGNVVLLEDFLNEATRLARERVDDQCADLPEAERSAIAEMIGIGAVRFAILSVRPNRNVIFDWDSAVSFTGDTGPYIQYSCTRIASILRKAGIDPEQTPAMPGMCSVTHDAEWELLLRLGRTEADIAQALALRNPAILATTALDVARRFSIFYNECPVLNAPDQSVREFRISLAVATRRVLTTLLGLMGISTPERM